MTTAKSLFDQALSKIPDPKNPKPGDTYEYTIYSEVKIKVRLVVIEYLSDVNVTSCYINGKKEYVNNLDFLLRSVKNAKPVITES